MERILRSICDGATQWVSSEALAEEIGKNPNVERRLGNAALLPLAAELMVVNNGIVCRAQELQSEGYGAFDALHLACAEAASADVLLTTDDAFIKKAARGDGSPVVAIRNPVSWSQEDLS